MCSGSEAGSYVRLIDFVYHSTLGLSVIKKRGVTMVRRRMAGGSSGKRLLSRSSAVSDLGEGV